MQCRQSPAVSWALWGLPALLGALFLLSPASPCAANLMVQTLEPNRQSRFYTGGDKAFLGQPFDWSGVGNTSTSGAGQWATMISPSYFVSAAHYHPGPGASLTFFTGNDPNGASHTYSVGATTFQGSYKGLPSDLWVGKLTSPIPTSDHITYYPIANLGGDSEYNNLPIFVYGVPNLIGRNAIDNGGIVDAPENVNDDPNLPVVKDTRSMQYTYNTGAAGVGADEAYLVTGDSGAPSFAIVDGSLALVGAHYYHSGTDSGANGDFSGDTFVPFYASQINAALTGSGEQVTLVPEPGTGVLLLGAGVIFAGRRRRSVR